MLTDHAQRSSTYIAPSRSNVLFGRQFSVLRMSKGVRRGNLHSEQEPRPRKHPQEQQVGYIQKVTKVKQKVMPLLARVRPNPQRQEVQRQCRIHHRDILRSQRKYQRADHQIQHPNNEGDLVSESYDFGIHPFLLEIFDTFGDFETHFAQFVVHLLELAFGLGFFDELFATSTGARSHVAGEGGPLSSCEVYARGDVSFV